MTAHTPPVAGTAVVKLGGSAMEEPAATRAALETVVAMRAAGWRVVLVHGGGKPIDRAMAAAGIEPVKVQGRRYTDPATLEIVVHELMKLNRGIVSQIEALSDKATAYDDQSWFPLRGQLLMLPGLDLQPIDLGRVGWITQVRLDTIEDDLGPFNHLPVIPSLALDDSGEWLNVNADTVASAVAGALAADAALFLTDTPGVLTDRHDPGSLVPHLTAARCREMIATEAIAGGMVPKVEACLEALGAGAKRAVILDGRTAADLAGFLAGRPAGTAVTRD